MQRRTAVVLSDIGTFASALGCSLLLMTGIVGCVAIATLLAHLVLLQPQAAVDTFYSVISLSGLGLVEPLRQLLEGVNWLGLVAISLFSLSFVGKYLKSISQRVIPQANIVEFPQKLVEYEFEEVQDRKAANW